MSSREFILDRVRLHPPPPVPLPPLPAFAPPPGALLDRFGASLVRMGGTLADAPVAQDWGRWIQERFPQARVVCSAAAEVPGTRDVHAVRHPRELDDVDVGVVRAAFGVAETGSVWLSERELVVNALAFLSQHLVVLLDPSSIVPGLHDAYRDRRFFEARFAVLLTGPSATADIEGVLVRGAQGVRSLTVVPCAAPPAAVAIAGE